MVPDHTNKVLKNATQAIDALGAHGALTAPELAVELEMPRPSAYRLLSALVHAGFAEQLPDGQVALSARWLHLGDAALRGMSTWFNSDDVLERMRDDTGLTVYFCLPRDNEAICVRRLHGQNFQVLVLKPGGTLPLYVGAVGRTLLAFGDVDTSKYLADAPFRSITPRTLTEKDDLIADIALTRERGYCLSDEDVTVGVGAIGVPVVDSVGRTCAALSLAGVREQIVEDQERLAGVLKSASARITDAIRRSS